MEVYKVFREQLALIFIGILYLLLEIVFRGFFGFNEVYCVYSEVDLKLVLSTVLRT